MFWCLLVLIVERLRLVFGIDLRTLALFRVGAALLILADLATRVPDLAAHYTDAGILPRGYAAPLTTDLGLVSVHLASGDLWFQVLLFALAGFVAMLMLIGYRARTACAVSWLLLVSVQVRNPLLTSGADMLLAALLFWGMFLPLGARWSVDAALDPDNEDHANQYCSVASAAMLLQVMSVYLFTALLKSGPEWWPDGTAVYYTLQLDAFVTPLGAAVSDWAPLLKGLTYLVLLLEFVCPVLVFLPVFTVYFRLACIALLLLMHLGFLLLLEVALFPYVSVLSLLVFVPGRLWDRLGQKNARQRQALRIYYDPECEYCRRVSRVIASLLVLPFSTIVRSAEEDSAILGLLKREYSWVVVDARGNPATGFAALTVLVRASPVWFWLAPLLGLAPLRAMGEAAYRWAAHRRGSLAALLLPRLPIRRLHIDNPWPVSSLIAVLMLLVLAWNLHGIPQTDWRIPAVIPTVLDKLRLKQRWSMFAPHPLKTEGWVVIEGALEDGSAVDVYRGKLGRADTARPDDMYQSYGNDRWRKFFDNLRRPEWQQARLYYARYLCRQWNADQPAEKRLAEFRIIFYKETTLPDYAPPRVEPVVLWVHDCRATAEDIRQRRAQKGIEAVD